jgi:hypothetical protein
VNVNRAKRHYRNDRLVWKTRNGCFHSAILWWQCSVCPLAILIPTEQYLMKCKTVNCKGNISSKLYIPSKKFCDDFMAFPMKLMKWYYVITFSKQNQIVLVFRFSKQYRWNICFSGILHCFTGYFHPHTHRQSTKCHRKTKMSQPNNVYRLKMHQQKMFLTTS